MNVLGSFTNNKPTSDLFIRINSFSEKQRQVTPNKILEDSNSQKKRILSLYSLYNTPSIDHVTLKKSITAHFPLSPDSYLETVINSTKVAQIHSATLIPSFQIPPSKIPEEAHIFSPLERQTTPRNSQQDDVCRRLAHLFHSYLLIKRLVTILNWAPMNERFFHH